MHLYSLLFHVILFASSSIFAQTTTTTSSSTRHSSAASSSTTTTATNTTISLTTIVSASGNATSTIALPSLETVSPCVAGCIATAAGQAGCSSMVDVNCFCASSKFRTSFPNCIASTCSDPSQVNAAESLANQFCAAASPSTAIQFPSPTATFSTATDVATAPPTSSAPAASSSAPNAALRNDRPLGWTESIGLLAGIIGLLAL
ncbi:hypothetical protein DL96DRAFT_1719441 [Flagelloscypha sp. PMI_526]|nr:hypothetical protein DL96DRAFT_1719441 [Flagelloscypha sp. PMI_526]